MGKEIVKNGTFVWRVAAAHVIAYFIAGILALFILDYKTQFSSDSLSLLMKPVESPWVMLGPALQVIRGIVLGLVLLTIRSVIIGRQGFWKLVLLVLGLSFFSTIGPTPGSFDGYIYTILPLQYHLGAIPEAVVYTLIFSGLVTLPYKYEKKYITVVYIILVVIILLFSIMGFAGMEK